MSCNKKKDMVASDDYNKYDDDYEEEGRLDDELLRKIGMLCNKCKEYKSIIKGLRMELRLSKSHARQTKHHIKINYDWDGEKANFTDSVLVFSEEYLFPHYKFLKDNGPYSLSLFVRGKVKIPEGAGYKNQQERVLCPTIQMKYVTIRCNLNNNLPKHSLIIQRFDWLIMPKPSFIKPRFGE